MQQRRFIIRNLHTMHVMWTLEILLFQPLRGPTKTLLYNHSKLNYDKLKLKLKNVEVSTKWSTGLVTHRYFQKATKWWPLIDK